MLGEAALADSPVTLSGLGLLENVNARLGITIAEIARRAPQTQQALSQITARLAKLGFIERRLTDRGRGIALHLTPAGASARAQAHEAGIEGHHHVGGDGQVQDREDRDREDHVHAEADRSRWL
jgi:DNA-binding MarR family transcriptional regulator